MAKVTDEKAEYIKQRGIDDDYCKQMIEKYLQEFGEGKREDFENVLLKKLPDVLTVPQKQNKVRNILQKMRKEGLIEPRGKSWKMSKPKL